MKRLCLLLLAALLLVGCGRREPVTDNMETSTQAEETTGLYVPDSAAEQQTAGAVRMYALNNDAYFGMTGIGANLLVMGQKGLTVLAGDKAEVIAALETSDVTAVSVMDTASTGMAYYLTATRQVVVLNPQLQRVTEVTLPEGIVGQPVICLAKNEVYYAIGSEVRALNLSTGISRLIRQQAAASRMLLGAYFDGAVLLCQFTDEAGNAYTEYISTETGQPLTKGTGISNLQTSGTEYFVSWQDGTVRHLVFGTRGGESYSFLAPNLPQDKTAGRVAVMPMGGVVDYVETENGLELSYYDLKAGKRTAQVTIPQTKSPSKIYSDGTYIWMLTTDETSTLYRWDITKSPVVDETVYVGTLYTAQTPDTQGLADCRAYADVYQKKYGVKVLFWEDAVKHNGGHTLVAEHKPQIVRSILDQIEPVLAQFPSKFLQKTVEKGWIQIALVQSIDADKDWVQFWEDGDCWVLISVKADPVKSLIQGMAYAIDSHVLGNSRDFDNWNQFNPEGFAYTYGAQAEIDPAYLEGETRAFAEEIAVTYPHEDRCKIFYHAMLPDNAQMFASPAMKAKLLRVCTGIREAYNLEKKTDSYVWEQYLDTSLAFVKE
ncbi:MAG: hypothetical protein IJZ14_01935 [Oscillospiraceae bacterium]|nr:hypothetical protein [Oscillospiraceae bacterium]